MVCIRNLIFKQACGFYCCHIFKVGEVTIVLKLSFREVLFKEIDDRTILFPLSENNDFVKTDFLCIFLSFELI